MDGFIRMVVETEFSKEGEEAIKEIAKKVVQKERMRISILVNQVDYLLREVRGLKNKLTKITKR